MSHIGNYMKTFDADGSYIQLKYVRCPNCKRINGAMSIDTKGVQQFICKDSRCRHEFYTVDGLVDKEFNKKVEFV